MLRVVDLPEPHAGPGEVRVRVRAAAVNPADTLLRAGVHARAFAGVPAPYVPGMDIAGEIDEIGPGTRTELSPGEPVMAMVMPIGPAAGGYAEYVVLPAGWVVRAPAGADGAAAATLPMNGLTAQLTLDQPALAPGSILAVTGAAGTLGGYLVQLGRHAGLTVVADAAPADEALVRRLGAADVVTRGPDVAARLRDRYPDGVDAVADTALIGPRLLDAVRDGGTYARFLAPMNPAATNSATAATPRCGRRSSPTTRGGRTSCTRSAGWPSGPRDRRRDDRRLNDRSRPPAGTGARSPSTGPLAQALPGRPVRGEPPFWFSARLPSLKP
ncbi:alcohol dehydrogenase catalytic domain-containing protein [Nonomuraea sp. GTA35]|uniref:alcohol dehydrogenase catalytic domain-containing protein n=1 Tax=Nonomuraea sp. GTA35 TaxID=1676746 RepID=UPI0035C1E8FC